MITYKQLEAVYWVVQLQGFAQAANKLNTTQSAVSKRVQEIELLFDIPLFDRSARSARLTEKGEEMYMLAKKLLEQRDIAIEQFLSPDVLEKHITIGVTELTAMTWLPQLIQSIYQVYPRVTIEPLVDMSSILLDKLIKDEIDLIVIPEVFKDQRLTSKRIGLVENSWITKYKDNDTKNVSEIFDLDQYTFLVQDDRSGTGLFYNNWFKTINFMPSKALSANSLVALIGLTISGIGISYLPHKCLEPMINSKTLSIINSNPSLPPIPYAVIFRSDRKSKLISTISLLAEECCNFDTFFQP